jgi:hypothetical protein
VPEAKQPVERAGLDLIHGHQMRAGGMYPARKMVELYGRPNRTVACGHHHKHQQIPKPMRGGGFGVGVVLPDGRSTLEVVEVHGGVCTWGGKVFRAEAAP